MIRSHIQCVHVLLPLDMQVLAFFILVSYSASFDIKVDHLL